MDFYLILQEIMDEKGLNIPSVARLCNLSDGTIRSAIVRKQKNVALEVAFKLSKGLNVSLERLNGMPEPKFQKKNPGNLSPEEMQIAMAYHRASEDDRAVVNAALRKYIETGKNEQNVAMLA